MESCRTPCSYSQIYPFLNKQKSIRIECFPHHHIQKPLILSSAPSPPTAPPQYTYCVIPETTYSALFYARRAVQSLQPRLSSAIERLTGN